MNKKKTTVLILLMGAIGVFACWKIFSITRQSNTEIEDFQNLAALIQMSTEPVGGGVEHGGGKPSETRPEESETSATPSAESLPPETQTAESVPSDGGRADGLPEPVFTRNLQPLFDKNSDFVGWVSIANTNIDYPVMFTPQEPEKYLRKNFNGEYSHSGVPFLQSNNTLDSDNLIIYGHNMKNGTMFSNLTDYLNREYAAGHPVIEFETARGLKQYEVFAVALIWNSNGWYQFVDAYDEANFQEQIAALTQIARFTLGNPPQYGQQLLTLSTCYGSDKNARLIVVAATRSAS